MLLNKKIEVGTIISVKLVSGDELITKMVGLDEKVIRISKPIAVAMAPNGSVAFIPFMLGADEDVELTINLAKIVTYVAARKELRDAYIQNTSGLVTAGANEFTGGAGVAPF